jgi:ParB/RepB/Spo0J family partition protein
MAQQHDGDGTQKSIFKAVKYVRMSTEHQQYSTENQADKIIEYAERRGIEIIRTYADEGKSGLRIEGRVGLQELIKVVESGQADFQIILVYDISRWGRFQDADESAYYEYICRRKGIQVAYCAEQFENDGSPVSTIVKGVKERYLLVCGEGRMKAFKALGETSIPAMIVNVSDDDAFIMSLAENIARRHCRAIELLAGIQRLRDQGYDKSTIAEKTGLSIDYIQGILQLLGNKEDRLITAVEAGKIPLYVALAINGAGNDDKAIQIALQEAYESGKLKGKQLINAKRLVEKRQALGKTLGG